MNGENDHWDEQRLAALLRSLDTDAAPADRQFLARLRELSAQAFAAEFSRQTQLPARRRRMFVMAMRGLAAAAAAAVIVATCFWSADTGGEASQFGKVLENMARADAVHLKITRDGKAGDLWVRRPDQAEQPSQLRWNHPDGTYTIARGDRLWLVDEK